MAGVEAPFDVRMSDSPLESRSERLSDAGIKQKRAILLLHLPRLPTLPQWACHPGWRYWKEEADMTRTAFITGATSGIRSEEHTSKLQSLMRISYAVFCLKKTKKRH